MELQRPPPLRGAQAQIEELDEGIELVMDERLVERRERDGLRQAGAGLDEDQFRVQRGTVKRGELGGEGRGPDEDGVGGELEEIGRIVGP